MKFELPELPYPKDALAPYISAETLEYHHGRHHAAYVKNLNELIKGSKFAEMKLEEIITKAEPGPIFNNAAQHWNHSFYWRCMSPKGGKPDSEIADLLKKSFGGFEEFKKKFDEAAVKQFGSGWAWLIDADGRLEIETTHDADLPLAHGKNAIMTCDVWEHAYYIDYRNARAKYVEAFWNVVNWQFVASNLK